MNNHKDTESQSHREILRFFQCGLCFQRFDFGVG